MKKLISTLIALSIAGSFAGSASADEFYIDIGSNQGGNANTANGPNTTGWLDQLSFLYESTSVITDGGVGGANALSVGDTILSAGGVNNGNFVDPTGISNNLIDGFEPSETTFGGPSNNGFGPASPLQWGLTFGFPDLAGTWNGSGFDYTSGTISMYYYDNTMTNLAGFVRLFDLQVSSGGDTGNSTVLNGQLVNFNALSSVNGVDAADVFNFALGSFGELSGPPNNQIVSFNASQDTQAIGALQFAGGQAEFAASHNGSINFSQVPEPASIAILGLGLLGFAGAKRRKAK
ncbi:PEP-CTERM sorting domain-containing protein [Colwellia sp. MB02u-9]|uniref:PEP-CTERM sorting domain-containing protein n=1 Tax=Colwellia sp. MB02u-9 TaxID=2759823 RepID=UPI0015F59B23|nr:PEP-CTERM sorting domain-containing protein [Colwellia sp. MB02u-9]MBA6295163.1 PEP-CTERM sorting domain-containing protein [Colwellia sp. MB02u-9]